MKSEIKNEQLLLTTIGAIAQVVTIIVTTEFLENKYDEAHRPEKKWWETKRSYNKKYGL